MGIGLVVPLFFQLCFRGLLLWLLIPLSMVWWAIISAVRLTRRRPFISPFQVLGWADLNLIACLMWMTGRRVPLTGWADVDAIHHRVSLTDPW